MLNERGKYKHLRTLRTWNDVIDELDFESLGLTETEQTFLYFFFEAGQNVHRARRLLTSSGLTGKEQFSAKKAMESERVTLAINRVRMMMNDTFRWDLNRSKEFSMNMLMRCEAGLESADGDKEARLWMKAAEFWKDNVDRISGLLLDRKQILVEQKFKEFEYLDDRELVKMYEELKEELTGLNAYDDEEFIREGKLLESHTPEKKDEEPSSGDGS